MEPEKTVITTRGEFWEKIRSLLNELEKADLVELVLVPDEHQPELIKFFLAKRRKQ